MESKGRCFSFDVSFTLFSACNQNLNDNVTAKQSTDNCRVVQHTMGESCILIDPKRIIALDLNTLGNLLALDIKPIAANSGWDAVEPFPKHLQNQLDNVEYVGSTTQPSLEKMLLLKPDLILTNSNMESFYQQLSQIAPTVVMQHPNTWKERFLDLAQILKKEDKVNELMDEYQQRIQELQQALGDKRSNLIVSAATAQQTQGIYAYGDKYHSSIVLNDIGVQRPASQRGDFYYTEPISTELVSEIDGDILLFVTWQQEADKESLEKLKRNPLWRKLKVVKSDLVYQVESDHWYRDHSFLAVNEIIDDLEQYLLNSNSDS